MIGDEGAVGVKALAEFGYCEGGARKPLDELQALFAAANAHVGEVDRDVRREGDAGIALALKCPNVIKNGIDEVANERFGRHDGHGFNAVRLEALGEPCNVEAIAPAFARRDEKYSADNLWDGACVLRRSVMSLEAIQARSGSPLTVFTTKVVRQLGANA